MESFEEIAMSQHDFKKIFADKTYQQLVEYNAQAKRFIERHCRWDTIVMDVSQKMAVFYSEYLRDVYPNGMKVPGSIPGIEIDVNPPRLFTRFTLIPDERCIEFRIEIEPLGMYSARTFALDDIYRAHAADALLKQIISRVFDEFQRTLITTIITDNYKSYAHSKR